MALSSGLTTAMRASCASIASTALTFFSRIAAASCDAVRKVVSKWLIMVVLLPAERK
ncbi:hypothetical protein [Mesorhizobium sp.]|uniref:hypothetical protein n=1 Tax=Mesorhizobium sp. TaxID=1871066 RepID=UPI0025D5C8AE|nr:hypothetical protein [Mesorhizobium sp.]